MAQLAKSSYWQESPHFRKWAFLLKIDV